MFCARVEEEGQVWIVESYTCIDSCISSIVLLCTFALQEIHPSADFLPLL